jgi:pimeloyl-ACP methyl ester carboxylesterase
VETPDGRTIVVHDEGDRTRPAILYHHGTPGTGELYARWVADARERGLRLIGYNRAGYSGSTRNEGRSVADVAADVTAILDALEIERCASWGVSGGGPHVLACAALVPDRVVAVASLAAVAPVDADGLDWLAGMGGNVEEFGAARAGPEALRDYLVRDAAGFFDVTAEQLADAMRPHLSELDAAALTGEFAGFLHSTLVDAVASLDGWFDDDLAFVKPWGFDVGVIRVRVLLRQGVQDLMVPPDHGRWLAARIPGVEAEIAAGEGHLTLAAEIGRVHAWLAERL